MNCEINLIYPNKKPAFNFFDIDSRVNYFLMKISESVAVFNYRNFLFNILLQNSPCLNQDSRTQSRICIYQR